MKRTLLPSILLSLMTTLALGAGSNLLTNGDLALCPCLEENSVNKEDHTNVNKCAYPVGSTEIKGWEVTRDQVYLTYVKKSERRWIDLNGTGGVKQSFSSPSRGVHTLKFRLEGNPQGPSEQTVVIEGPGLNVQENVGKDNRRLVEVQFTPSESTSAIEIYATKSGRGPRIDQLSVESSR